MQPAFYDGIVTHTRFRPVVHKLRYRIFMAHLDLTAPMDAARGWLFGMDRPGLMSFQQKDHGARTRGGLLAWARAKAAEAGIDASGRVTLLCMPRVLGLVFNPLSMFFLHNEDGALSGIIHEVHNTFGQRHAYALPANPTGLIRQDCEKDFHVSPFMDMDLHYAFTVLPPGERTAVRIAVTDAGGKMLNASFAGSARAISTGNILRALLRLQWLGITVPLAIHWEAVKLLVKGMRLRPSPSPTGRRVRIAP